MVNKVPNFGIDFIADLLACCQIYFLWNFVVQFLSEEQGMDSMKVNSMSQ